MQPVDISGLFNLPILKVHDGPLVHVSMVDDESEVSQPVANVRSEGIEGGGGSSQPQW